MNNNLIAKCSKYDFLKLFNSRGYTYFTKGAYNLNIIGIRKSGTNVTNRFDDVLIVMYKDDADNWVRKIFPCTTSPGLTSMRNPVSVNGCAILVPGLYRGCWKIGLHKGRYSALCLYKTVKVYRDNNTDDIYDFNPSTIDRGIFGINIHKAGTNSIFVDNWSAGCLVFKVKTHFDQFMNICRELISRGMGSSFTYTLLNEEDLE